MSLSSIELIHFRSYSHLELELPSEGALFLGKNGAGKTNFLEAISVLLLGKSVRNSSIREMVSLNERESYIAGTLNIGSGISVSQSVGFSKNRDICIKRGGDTYHSFSALYDEKIRFMYFGPSDIQLITGTPDEKRRFFDIIISQTDKEYLHDIILYKRLIKERNKLINTHYNSLLIDVYDRQIAPLAVKIMNKRKIFFDEIAPIFTSNYNTISNEDIKIEIYYQPSSHYFDSERYYGELKARIEKDLSIHYTGFGPHRDTFDYRVGSARLSTFGSQGQCRSAAISLKSAAISYLSNNNKKNVIVAVDDAFSDLDGERKRRFFTHLSKKGQLLIAVHTVEELNYYELDKCFTVSEGKINVT